MTASPQKPDRYVSFDGIDCDGNAAKLTDLIRKYAAGPAKDNKFWQLFVAKLDRSAAGDTGVGDALYLVHSNVYYIRELFEEHGTEDDLALLDQVEEECC